MIYVTEYQNDIIYNDKIDSGKVIRNYFMFVCHNYNMWYSVIRAKCEKNEYICNPKGN